MNEHGWLRFLNRIPGIKYKAPVGREEAKAAGPTPPPAAPDAVQS